jgi:SAM-dependent methyltransferase
MTTARQLLDQANTLANENNHTDAVDLALQALNIKVDYDTLIDLHERISISGFYSKNPQHKDIAKNSCELIASDKGQPWHRKNSARQNYTWYAPSLAEVAKSTSYKQIEFDPKDNYHATNPSINVHNGQLWMIQRTVNYQIRPDGSYDMCGDSAIRTKNHLLKLDDNFNIQSAEHIAMPDNMPEPLYSLVVGFEDSRLFFWKGEPWCSSTVREVTSEGWCEIALARISNVGLGQCKLSDWRVVQPTFCDKQHEKNWMPVVINDNLFFIYSSDPVRFIDHNGNLVNETQSSIASDSYRGGGAAVHFDGGYLTLIHESTHMPYGKRRYLHRFVWYDRYGRLAKISNAFYIMKLGIEFSAGLAKHPNRDTIIVSFGLNDRESWLAELSCDDVRSILQPAGIDKMQLVDDIDTMSLIIHEINNTLDTSDKVRNFQNIAIKSRLPLHEDAQKNWDSILATYWTTLTCNITDPVMDVAGTQGSAYLPGLRLLGYRNLLSINLSQTETQIIDGVTYQYGDCTATSFPDNYFGFISCLSVIEHGVDVEKFLRESYRILKPNSYLFFSTDYWQDPVDTFGQTAFGVPVKVYTKDEILAIYRLAQDIGFKVPNEPNLQCNERTVSWIGMNYTFFNMLLQKK